MYGNKMLKHWLSEILSVVFLVWLPIYSITITDYVLYFIGCLTDISMAT